MIERSEARFQADVQTIFRTEEGQRVLDELTARYCRKNFDENPYRMGFNCGRSELVMFLAQLTEEQIEDERSRGPQHATG